MKQKKLWPALALGLIATACFAQASEKRSLRNQVRAPAELQDTVPYRDEKLNLIQAIDEEQSRIYDKPVFVDLVSSKVPAGSNSTFVKIKLSASTPNTVIAIIKCENLNGRSLKEPRVQAVIFRPGDSPTRSVKCDVSRAIAGDSVRFTQVHVPDGGNPGVRKAVAKFTSNLETSEERNTSARPPFAFMPLGKLTYQLDPARVKMGDDNAEGKWSTALSHGRTQPANNETGYYGTTKMGAVTLSDKFIALHTGRLEAPIDTKDGKQYSYLASVLSGHRYPDTFFKYGSIEWEARMPSRRGTWPALWLLPKSGWPPEIDIYEGFSNNPDWTPRASLSSAIHGGRKNKRSFKRWFMRLQMGDIGLKPNITSEFHKFQATISPDWITIFVDGVETVQFQNNFKGETWYPIMTNAVTAKSSDAYNEGTSNMEIRSLKIWKIE